MTPSKAPAPAPTPTLKDTELSVIEQVGAGAVVVVAAAATTNDDTATAPPPTPKATKQEDPPAAGHSNDENADDDDADALPPRPAPLPSSNNNAKEEEEQKQQQQQQPRRQQPAPSTTTPYPLWLSCDRWKAENLFRIAVCCGCSCALSVLPPDSGVPQDLKLLIGVFGAFLSNVYPKLVYTLLGVAPYFLTMMVLCCGTTTGLFVVAARYGQAWMIVAYSGYILALSVLLLGGTAEQRTKNDAGFYTGIGRKDEGNNSS